VQLAVVGDAVDVDFAQVEEGSFATSPIWTEGTPLARAGDVLSVSTAGWPVGAGRVSLRVQMLWSGTPADHCILDVMPGATFAGGVRLYTDGLSGATRFLTADAGFSLWAGRVYVWPDGGQVLVGGDWGGGVAGLTIDGTRTEVTGATMPTALAAEARLGSRAGGGLQINGWLADLEVSHV
jgi:hypothetical protein